MDSPKDILSKNETIKSFINNDFLIIPFEKINCMNLNECDEDVIRLHLDILKNEEDKKYV